MYPPLLAVTPSIRPVYALKLLLLSCTIRVPPGGSTVNPKSFNEPPWSAISPSNWAEGSCGLLYKKVPKPGSSLKPALVNRLGVNFWNDLTPSHCAKKLPPLRRKFFTDVTSVLVIDELWGTLIIDTHDVALIKVKSPVV